MLTSFILSLIPPAVADAPPASVDDARDDADVSSAGGARGSGNTGGSTGGSTSGDGRDEEVDGGGKGSQGKKGKYMGWNYQPYVSPGGGVQIDGSNTSVVAGADVGVKYWKRKWAGNLYAGGTYLTGSGVSGYDAHLGNTTGARLKYWGASGGAELFYDAQMTSGGGSILDPSLGLGVPVSVIVGPASVYGTATIEPAWLFSEARRGADVPLGDELTWSVSLSANIAGVRGSVGFAQRITAAGTFNTPTVSASF